MFPPQQLANIDLAALSGICGSISIACWVVVFSPQIIENFRRSSAEGLSITFIIIWLVGDVFNIVGGILQGILPTMIILAIYYTLADIVLLLQCFYYRGFTLSDDLPPKPTTNGHAVNPTEEDEERPLLQRDHTPPSEDQRRSSSRVRQHSYDATHLSPATPLHATQDSSAIKHSKPASPIQKALFNTTAILLVCLAGIFGWWISTRSSRRHHHRKDYPAELPDLPDYDFWGQISAPVSHSCC